MNCVILFFLYLCFLLSTSCHYAPSPCQMIEKHIIWGKYFLFFQFFCPMMTGAYILLMSLIKLWDTSIPMFPNLGWMSPPVQWLPWRFCFTFAPSSSSPKPFLHAPVALSGRWWTCSPFIYHDIHQTMRDVHAHVSQTTDGPLAWFHGCHETFATHLLSWGHNLDLSFSLWW
jgi:hypothetical protein